MEGLRSAEHRAVAERCGDAPDPGVGDQAPERLGIQGTELEPQDLAHEGGAGDVDRHVAAHAELEVVQRAGEAEAPSVDGRGERRTPALEVAERCHPG